MSKEYRDKIEKGEMIDMRVWCQRPGRKDKSGNNIYTTEQAHKDICDVNKIIRKYDKDGVITHVSRFEGKFGDLTGSDFKEMQDKVLEAKRMFGELPSEIRNRFQNSPYLLLEFMEDQDNRKEAEELGLINVRWTEETDGLGEHVKEGENVEVD